MFKLSEMFGQRGGWDAFGRRAVKNIGIRTDIGQTFTETGTTDSVVPQTGGGSVVLRRKLCIAGTRAPSLKSIV